MRKRVLSTLLLMMSLLSPVLGQYNWTKYAGNPAIPAWSGDVNDPSALKYALEPSVCFDSQKNVYRMWFTSHPFGYGTTNSISGAMSLDGDTWYMNVRNPVLHIGYAGDFDDLAIESNEVLYNGSEYMMYYSGHSSSGIRVGLAVSLDGIRWQKSLYNPVLDLGPSGSWDSLCSAYPHIVVTDSQYYMFYSGSNGSEGGVGLATSTDGIHWTKYAGNPILTHGAPGSWEDVHTMGVGGAVNKDGTFYMIFGGANTTTSEAALGIAVSSDGRVWTKYVNNPVIRRGNSYQWDATQLSGGKLMFLHNKFYYWYGGTDYSNYLWQIGYATSELTSLEVKSAPADVPEKFKLFPSHPNPFNPDTKIDYDVPFEAEVLVKIFNELGQEITTLVNERQFSGHHSIIWHAANAASGVYFCRMVAPEYSATMKLVLAK